MASLKSTEPTDAGRQASGLDWLSVGVVVSVTVAAYGPMVYSIFMLSARTTQAVNAFLLLGFAICEALVSVWRVHPFRLAVTTHGILLFSVSCLALAIASIFGLWPLAIVGLCLNMAALLSFCFGREGVRVFHPALAGLGCAAALVAFVPQADGALRLLAARGSAVALNLAGFQTQVVVQTAPPGIMLVVERGLSVFDVATECNGFGILLSSVVLTVILSVRRAYPWLLGVALVLAAGVTGLAFNTLRIVAISLASMNTMVDYGVIHEGLGTLVYLAALAAVWGGVGWAGRWRSTVSRH
jgi:exosortase/archaeosortase family protein